MSLKAPNGMPNPVAGHYEKKAWIMTLNLH